MTSTHASHLSKHCFICREENLGDATSAIVTNFDFWLTRFLDFRLTYSARARLAAGAVLLVIFPSSENIHSRPVKSWALWHQKILFMKPKLLRTRLNSLTELTRYSQTFETTFTNPSVQAKRHEDYYSKKDMIELKNKTSKHLSLRSSNKNNDFVILLKIMVHQNSIKWKGTTY